MLDAKAVNKALLRRFLRTGVLAYHDGYHHAYARCATRLRYDAARAELQAFRHLGLPTGELERECEILLAQCNQ